MNYDVETGEPEIDSGFDPAPYPGTAVDTPAPSVDDRSIAGGAAGVHSSKAPFASDEISNYILRNLNMGPKGPDPALIAAQKADALNRATSGAGAALSGIGDAFARNAQGFAGAIAGRGFDPPPAGSTGLLTQPYQPGDSAVAQYLTAKKAQDEAAKTDLDRVKEAVAAGKFMRGADPESLEGRKLTLAEAEAARRTRQGDEGNDIKKGQLDLGGKRFEETADYHKKLLELRAKGLTESEAKDELSRQKYELQRKRLGVAEEKLTNDEGAGMVPLADSQDRTLKPATAEQLNDRAQAAQSVLGTLSKIREIEKDHRLGLLAPSEAQAQLQTLFAELGPQWNSAQTKLAFSGARGAAISHALTDPSSLGGVTKDLLSGGSYTKTNLDQAEKLIRESLQHQGEARGVHFGGDFGPDTKSKKTRVRSAAPGRPGSGTGPGELTDEDSKALKWATDPANKADPRAAAIRKKLGVQ